MHIDTIRVQNFRCVRESGAIPLTPDLTIFIGENETGKTALLEALLCFNLENAFLNADLSTMSPTRESVLSGVIAKDTIDMVTIAINVSATEREQFNIPANVLTGDTLRITKRFDNSYVIKGANGTPLSELYANTKSTRLITEIKAIRRQLSSVYQGYVVRKYPQDQFVFLRKSQNEPESADLILFPIAAGDLWDSLSQGDLVQVTHQAPDPYGRNIRAMNAGQHVTFEEELSAVENSTRHESPELAESLTLLLNRIHSMPTNHPLRSIFGDDFQALLTEHLASSADPVPWDDDKILNHLPAFQRGTFSPVDDKISLNSIGEPESGECNGKEGLQALVDEVGLVPSEAVMAEHTERVRIFDDNSRRLSDLITGFWVKDVQAEFVPFNQDKELGLAISSQGSLDPPSRRSHGFNSYLGLAAGLLGLGKPSTSNLVLLLDDPAMHLHPIAQEKLADLLGKQRFQVLVATHFPFMIESERLDRVRLLCRTEGGAYLEENWRLAGEGLLPVKGALSRWTLGHIPVLVEGKTDRETLIRMSEYLSKDGKDSMPHIMEPLPAGGSAMVDTAKALQAMDIRFIALVDGDSQGNNTRRKLIQELGQPETSIVSLSDIVEDVELPKLEDLFSQDLRSSMVWSEEKLGGTLRDLGIGKMQLDQQSEDNLILLFQMLNKAIKTEY